MSDHKPQIPFTSPVMPAALNEATQIQFRCYKGISCFNACCKQADVTLAPYDILRLKDRLGMTSTDFLAQYTVPFEMDGDGMPGIKLKTTDAGTCLLLNGDEGCGVYSDRPTVCRYYPVALLQIRHKEGVGSQQNYSLVTENHCKGHLEDRKIAIGDYRAEQGVVEYDDHNAEWYQLILKKKSAGPSVGRPPMASLRLFFLASYDIDTFRRFVLSENFRTTYVLPDEFYAEVEASDLDLLRFAYRFLRQVLFGERSVEEVANAWDKRMEERKDLWAAQVEFEVQRRTQAEDTRYSHCDDGPSCGDK
jgi:Fe-S-cluster containining protein